MPGSDPVRETFGGIVGPGHVVAGDDGGPWAIDGLRPRAVVFPGSVEEVGRCLAEAAQRGLAVAPAGQGARLGWGAPPTRLDAVVSLHRLDRVLAHEPADLTMSVEAGVPLDTLNDRLRAHAQFLPLDPAWPERSTVGGLVATGAAGPYRARYGTMRDLLLGVTVVLADGTVVKAGGRVVKNVTGYDVTKLHVGALGTLGVVVECHLRLHPRPPAEATRVFGYPALEAALDAAVALRETPVVASRLQLLDGASLSALGDDSRLPAALAVTVGSVPAAVRTEGERIDEVCRRTGGRDMAVTEPDAWWARVSAMAWPDDPSPGETGSVVLRIGVRPSDVVKALRAVEARAGATGLRLRATAEAANGVLHAVLHGGSLTGIPRLVDGLRADLARLQGTCVVEHAPPDVKRRLDVWGDVGPALPVMRRLKAELDPGAVLNPGRFVGGI